MQTQDTTPGVGGQTTPGIGPWWVGWNPGAGAAPSRSGGAAPAPLGIPTKSSSGGASDHLTKWAAQAEVRRLWPGCRAASCCIRKTGSTVETIYHAKHQAASFAGLMRCGSVWCCALCGSKLSSRRRDELTALVQWARAQGYTPVLVTSTVPHGKSQGLRQVLAALTAARASMRSGRWAQGFADRWGQVGTVTALEVTHGENGWHPHLHQLLILSGRVDVEQLERELGEKWRAAVTAAGLGTTNGHGVKVQEADAAIGDYIAKFGAGVKAWTAADEVARGNRKQGQKGGRSPMDLLKASADGDEPAGLLWLEFAVCFKGKRQLVWSKGLRKLAGLGVELTDEELMQEKQEEGKVLCTFDAATWSAICKRELRGQVLEAASSGDAKAVWKLLRKHGIRQARAAPPPC